MKHLKQMAKLILEERIQPILLPDEEYQEGMSNYTFHIVSERKTDGESSPGYKLPHGENQQSTIMEAPSVDEDMD